MKSFHQIIFLLHHLWMMRNNKVHEGTLLSPLTSLRILKHAAIFHSTITTASQESKALPSSTHHTTMTSTCSSPQQDEGSSLLTDWVGYIFIDKKKSSSGHYCEAKIFLEN